MAILRFSNNVFSSINSNQASGATALFGYHGSLTAAQISTGYPLAIVGGADNALPDRRFNIYTGVAPSDFTSFTAPSQRAADLLIAFRTPPYTGTTAGGSVDAEIAQTSTVQGGQRTLTGIVNTPTAAAASGTATWFLMSRNDDLVNGPAIIGSVGLTGSGADLEIPDVNIVAGQSYRSAGFYFFVPTVQTLA